MSIKYGTLRMTVVNGNDKVLAGTVVKFDDGDLVWGNGNGFAGQGFFNAPQYRGSDHKMDRNVHATTITDTAPEGEFIFDATSGVSESEQEAASASKPSKKGKDE